MTARLSLYVLLAAVAAAGAVLSFAALRDLALLCGFSARLAWLLPVVVDAGAAAGSLVWLGGHGDVRAGRFACRLALVLLASSVAANAVSHGLAAYGARPAWWLVVLVSAVAPGVLGAVVHLSVLVGRSTVTGHGRQVSTRQDTPLGDVAVWDGNDLAPGLDLTGWPTASPLVTTPVPAEVEVGGEVAPYGFTGTTETEEGWNAYAVHLIGKGWGRKRLARELDLTEHEARELLAKHKPRQEAGGEDVA